MQVEIAKSWLRGGEIVTLLAQLNGNQFSIMRLTGDIIYAETLNLPLTNSKLVSIIRRMTVDDLIDASKSYMIVLNDEILAQIKPNSIEVFV